MPVLSEIDKQLLEKGFDSFSIYEKNKFIMYLANKNGQGMLTYLEISESDIMNYHKELKKAIINEQCEDTIIGGFTSAINGHVYRTNRDDQINMIGQKDELLSNPSISTVMWKTEDVGYISHTREDWFAIYTEAFAHKKKTLFKCDSLKGQMKNTTSDLELVSIKW